MPDAEPMQEPDMGAQQTINAAIRHADEFAKVARFLEASAIVVAALLLIAGAGILDRGGSLDSFAGIALLGECAVGRTYIVGGGTWDALVRGIRHTSRSASHLIGRH